MKPMPSKEDMKKDLAAETKALRDSNIPADKTHQMGKLRHKKYYKELAETADVDNFADGYANLATDTFELIGEDPINYRSYDYTLSADRKTFERTNPK